MTHSATRRSYCGSGGAAKAQTLAAGTFAVSTQVLASGHCLATSTVDPFRWTLPRWLLIRWLRTRADGYWEVSVLDRYDRDLGLPEPASGNRGYKPLGEVDAGTAKPSCVAGQPMWPATGRTEPWPTLWPKLTNTHT